jgi:hypothetical protein
MLVAVRRPGFNGRPFKRFGIANMILLKFRRSRTRYATVALLRIRFRSSHRIRLRLPDEVG